MKENKVTRFEIYFKVGQLGQEGDVRQALYLADNNRVAFNGDIHVEKDNNVRNRVASPKRLAEEAAHLESEDNIRFIRNLFSMGYGEIKI